MAQADDIAAAGAALPFGYGYRNRLINPFFDIWQRATSFASPATASYTADRWLSLFDGTAGTYTVSRQATTPGVVVGDMPERAFFLRYNASVAGSGNTFRWLSQRIEGVRNFAGMRVAVKIALGAASATTVGVSLRQNFGTGGSPSAAVDVAAQNLSVTTTPTVYTLFFDVPSISGRTLGTNGDDSLQFNIVLPNNATYTVDVYGVEIAGGAPVGWERRPIGTELSLCSRYFQAFRSLAASAGSFGSGYSHTTSVARISVSGIQPMRAAPTQVTVSAASDFAILDVSANIAVTNITALGVSPTAVSLTVTTGATQTAGRGVLLADNASANAALFISAEL